MLISPLLMRPSPSIMAVGTPRIHDSVSFAPMNHHSPSTAGSYMTSASHASRGTDPDVQQEEIEYHNLRPHQPTPWGLTETSLITSIFIWPQSQTLIGGTSWPKPDRGHLRPPGRCGRARHASSSGALPESASYSALTLTNGASECRWSGCEGLAKDPDEDAPGEWGQKRRVQRRRDPRGQPSTLVASSKPWSS